MPETGKSPWDPLHIHDGHDQDHDAEQEDGGGSEWARPVNSNCKPFTPRTDNRLLLILHHDLDLSDANIFLICMIYLVLTDWSRTLCMI